MSPYKNRNQIRQRSGAPLDRRMDKWIQTGKQVVDGVAGNRPGHTDMYYLWIENVHAQLL